MQDIQIIPFEAGEAVLDWIGLTDALAAGHDLPKAEIGDTFLYRGDDTLLSRAAWIDGLGIAVKSATVFPGNPAKGAPMINGGLSLYDDAGGAPGSVVGMASAAAPGGNVPLQSDFAPVPEPSGVALVGLAGTALLLRRRRK